ncbi:hypothetical protein ACFJGV_15085 [Cnuibacter sp. UC19_7]|uniref:hypothetical protein n=1 Tax=Cnuibacter sp. UC19_7 TaxID=3350166 RepID=UPI00366E686E
MTDTDDRPCIRRCIRAGTETDLLPARHGHYCHRCYTRTVNALALAPELIEHLVHQYEPSTSRQLQEVLVPTSDTEAKLPFNALAFDSANDLYRTLVYLVNHLAPKLYAEPPRPARRSWRDQGGQVLGIPAGASPEDARANVTVIVDWLTQHLDAIYQLDTDTIEDLDPFVKDRIHGIAKSWPRENRARYSDMPHLFTSRLEIVEQPDLGEAPVQWRTDPDDRCGGRIAIHPPRFEDDPEVIQCEACQTEFQPEEYETALADYLKLKRDERNARDRARAQEAARVKKEREKERTQEEIDQLRAAAVQRHLVAKYLNGASPRQSSGEERQFRSGQGPRPAIGRM